MAAKFTGFKNFKWLRYIFPNDPVIVVLRHPIDNYISFKLWELKHNVIPPSPSDWFNHRVPYAIESFEKIDNKLLLYFEDIVQQPQATMDKVCDFIRFD